MNNKYILAIENYDDAVAVKPIHENQYPYSNCTENILIDNCRVKLGVGMSIGSVPPNPNVNCVRNITIRNVRFDEPFKVVFVQTSILSILKCFNLNFFYKGNLYKTESR
jgi:hypothetical protein